MKFFARPKRTLREASRFGGLLIRDRRGFRDELWQRIRAGLTRMWHAKGGGYYGCGFVICFVWLEIRLFVDDIFGAGSVGGFVGQRIVELFFRFTVESLINTGLAAIWPALVIARFGAWSIAALVAGYWLFARFIKPPLQKLLFDQAPDPTQSQTDPD